MSVEVRWSWKSRAGLGLFVPGLAALSLYAFTTTNDPNPVVGWLAAAGAGCAVLLQGPLAWYRLRADHSGFAVRSVLGGGWYEWGDVRKVESIAQASRPGKIVRWEATPEEAFHIVIHTRVGKVSIHRGMSGIDDLLALMGGLGVLDRDDPSVAPTLRPSSVRDVLNRVHDGLELVYLAILVFPLGWFGGLIVVAVNDLSLTGSFLVDGTLVALVPWILAYAAWWVIRKMRAERFGAAFAKPPMTATDAIATVASAVGGPLLLWAFVPDLIAAPDWVGAALAGAGLLLCAMPVRQIRVWLREP